MSSSNAARDPAQQSRDEVFAHIGREIAKQLGTSMDEEVATAVEKLQDDDVIAFGLVAIREGDDGAERAAHRAIDPAIVRESDRQPEDVIDPLHSALCEIWDSEVAEHE
jgi:hypothetical protein